MRSKNHNPSKQKGNGRVKDRKPLRSSSHTSNSLLTLRPTLSGLYRSFSSGRSSANLKPRETGITNRIYNTVHRLSSHATVSTASLSSAISTAVVSSVFRNGGKNQTFNDNTSINDDIQPSKSLDHGISSPMTPISHQSPSNHHPRLPIEMVYNYHGIDNTQSITSSLPSHYHQQQKHQHQQQRRSLLLGTFQSNSPSHHHHHHHHQQSIQPSLSPRSQHNRSFHATIPNRFGLFGSSPPPAAVGVESAVSADLDKAKQQQQQQQQQHVSSPVSPDTDSSSSSLSSSSPPPHKEAGYLGTDKSKLGKPVPNKSIPDPIHGDTKPQSGNDTATTTPAGETSKIKSLSASTSPSPSTSPSTSPSKDSPSLKTPNQNIHTHSTNDTTKNNDTTKKTHNSEHSTKHDHTKDKHTSTDKSSSSSSSSSLSSSPGGKKVIFDASSIAEKTNTSEHNQDLRFKHTREHQRDKNSQGGGGGGGSFLSSLLGMIFFGCASLLTAGLMSWQLRRREWKIGLIEERYSIINDEPKPMTELIKSAVFRMHRDLFPSILSDDEIMQKTMDNSSPSTHIKEELGNVTIHKHNQERKEKLSQFVSHVKQKTRDGDLDKHDDSDGDDDDDDIDDDAFLPTEEELAEMSPEERERVRLRLERRMLRMDTTSSRVKRNHKILERKIKDPTFYYDTDPLDADNIPDYDVFTSIDFASVVDSLIAFKAYTSFRNVSVDGQFDYDREVFIGPASPPLDPTGFKKIEMQKGYFVVTPFKLVQPIRINAPLVNEQGEYYYSLPLYIHEVFVNRGWISASYIRTYIDNPLREHDGKTVDSVLKQEQLVKQDVEKSTGASWGSFLNLFGISTQSISSKASSLRYAESDDIVDLMNKDEIYEKYGHDIPIATSSTTSQYPGLVDFNERALQSLGLDIETVYKHDPTHDEVYSLLSSRTRPLLSPLRRVNGILHYGAGLPADGNFPTTPIRDTDHESCTLLQPAVLANRIQIAPTTLHLGDTIISSLSREKTPETIALEASLPIIVIDSIDSNLSKRVRPLEADRAAYLHQDIIRMTMKRRSADDHVKFTTMPETHLAYAVTWGSLSLFSAYLATVMARKPVLRQRFAHLWDRKTYPSPKPSTMASSTDASSSSSVATTAATKVGSSGPQKQTKLGKK